MKRATLTLCLLIGTAIAPAQSFNPAIQIEGVREAASKVNDSQKTITCSAARAANSPQEVLDLCAALLHLVSPDEIPVSFAFYVVQQQKGVEESEILQFAASAAESRIDLQNGAAASSPGTTSAVERSGISDVLGAAVEAGAVTQSVNGTTLTLQANTLSLYRFLTNKEVFHYCPFDEPKCEPLLDRTLNRISGSATLNVSSTSSQTATGTVSGSSGGSGTSGSALIQSGASHLTGFTVRYQPINTLDLRSPAYLNAWKNAINDPSIAALAATAVKELNAAFIWYDPTSAWLATAEDDLRQKVFAGMDNAILTKAVTDQWDQLIKSWPQNNTYTANFKTFIQAANAYIAARDLAVSKIRQTQASGLTFEYDLSTPNNQPRVSTARVIYTLHPGTISADNMLSTGSQSATKKNRGASPVGDQSKSTNDSAITFNFAADLYNNPPPGTDVLKDFQAALQADHRFGNTIGTLAGYFQHQNSASALTIGPGDLAPGTNIALNGASATLLAPKGNIYVAQAMFTFAFKGGSKIPVGVTWASRTDLLKASEVRGHVGLNFDWSSLLLGGLAKSVNPSQP